MVESKVKSAVTRESKRRAAERKQTVEKQGGKKGGNAKPKAKTRWHKD